ncbi:hypothetical protein AVEN_217331-1 [Araneus ventricosus]|uniref:Uncharacterized protein n=1 Tax=Araneus ventricosus TaxID=182803 RepID=A0A4Y2EB69_ARAVE|nr:hypothetical protein AVEN_193311-1 [Araneus ventricosus]GBM26433.1 hypothetical protein AVEN_63747-1 [Araneus ventricosus]GBM26461.1 hypothetical protein AVEN_127426-1 [Araneus ventricosus]GBM26513.1 hypothetical protein AVEN_217331-1 [Araneus ventricosus]
MLEDSGVSVKVDIQGETAPRKWRVELHAILIFSSSIWLHANHITGQCDSLGLLRLLQLPFSKQDPAQLRRKPHSPSLSFMIQHCKWIAKEDENPNFSTTPCKLSSDFCNDDMFWSDASEIAWNGFTVNAKL